MWKLLLTVSLLVCIGCAMTVTKHSTIAELEKEIAVTRAKLAACQNAQEYIEIEKSLHRLINERNNAGTTKEPDT